MEFASRRTDSLKGVGTLRALACLACLGTLAGAAAACRRDRGGAARPPGPSAAAPTAFGLAGRVTDEADRAVPDAHVLAFGPLADAAATSRREARSDQGGRFAFEGLPRGRYTLLVEAVGLASLEPPPFDVPGPVPVVRLSGQGRSLSGSVVAAGAPVAGARVRLGGEGGTLARATLSDDAGRFVFHGLGGGAYTLRATKGNLASPIAAGVPTDDGAASPPDAGAARPSARLELGTGLGVAGVVVDDAGKPLPGAEVRAESSPEDPLADAVTTKPDGRFLVGPLPPGRFRLVAGARGYLLRASANVTLAAGTGPPPPRLELVRAASAEGRVADMRGASIAGAQIRYGGGGADLTDLAVIFDPLPLAAEAAALAGGGPGAGAAKVARSDANGEFRLDDLLPGPVHLAVTRAPFAPLELETGSLAPGERRPLGVLTLLDPAPPDAGAAPADATVAGVARDTAGRPLARARVRAWPLGAGTAALAAPPSTPAVASAVTDAGGHFTLARVPRATLLLALDHPAYPPVLATTFDDGPTELLAPVPGGIDGEVREHVTGAPVARASVDGVGPNGQRVAAAAKKGAATFRLPRLRPGHWTLTARAPGYRATVRDVEVPESPILGETSVRGLRLELDLDR